MADSACTGSVASGSEGGSGATGTDSTPNMGGSATGGSMDCSGLGDGTRVEGLVGTREAGFGVEIAGGTTSGPVGIVGCSAGTSVKGGT